MLNNLKDKGDLYLRTVPQEMKGKSLSLLQKSKCCYNFQSYTLGFIY